MDPKNVVKLLQAKLPDLEPGSKWQASHLIDGVPTAQRPTVQHFACGIQNGDVFFKHDCTENGQPCNLWGTYSLKNIGEQITLNGDDVEADDVIVSNRFAGLKLRGVVEYQFVKDNQTHRYRFDATLYSPV
jgi:hypothetical protein